MQQQRPQHILGRDRRPARRRIKRVELRVQRNQHRIRQFANLVQKMILSNTLLQRQTTEHLVLKPLVSTHNPETKNATEKS